MNSTLKKERKSDVLFSGKKEKKNTTWCHISVFSVHILAFLPLLALMVSIWVIFPLVPAFHHWLTLRMRRHTGKINIQTKTGHTHSYTQRNRDARYENLGVLTATGKPPTVNEIFTTALSSALFITQDLLLQLQRFLFKLATYMTTAPNLSGWSANRIEIGFFFFITSLYTKRLLYLKSDQQKPFHKTLYCTLLHLLSDIIFHLWSPRFQRPALVFPHQLCAGAGKALYTHSWWRQFQSVWTVFGAVYLNSGVEWSGRRRTMV